MSSMTLLFILINTQIVKANSIQIGSWVIVNDTVMGGVSHSIVQFEDRDLVFKGYLSLKNNGGFASSRAVLAVSSDQTYGTVRLCVVGDGRDFKLRFRTSRRFDGIAYSANFSTIKGQPTCIDFKESDFKPTFRGFEVASAPKFTFANVRQIGLMIADKKEGEFELRVQSLSFF